MAIAFGANDGRNVQGTAVTSYTISSITTSGSNLWGTVAIETTTNGTTDVVATVTWNGNTLTRVGQRANASGGAAIYLYGGVITAGTGSIVITTSGASTNFIVHWMYHTGVGAKDASASTNGSGSGTSITISFTPTTDGAWMLVYGSAKDTPGAGIQAGTGTTKRGSDNDDNNLFDNNAAISPPAATNMTLTQTNSEAFSYIAYAIDPVGAAATPSRLSMLGVG